MNYAVGLTRRWIYGKNHHKAMPQPWRASLIMYPSANDRDVGLDKYFFYRLAYQRRRAWFLNGTESPMTIKDYTISYIVARRKTDNGG